MLWTFSHAWYTEDLLLTLTLFFLNFTKNVTYALWSHHRHSFNLAFWCTQYLLSSVVIMTFFSHFHDFGDIFITFTWSRFPNSTLSLHIVLNRISQCWFGHGVSEMDKWVLFWMIPFQYVSFSLGIVASESFSRKVIKDIKEIEGIQRRTITGFGGKGSWSNYRPVFNVIMHSNKMTGP